MNALPRVSVILSTYNAPGHLSQSLCGFAHQHRLPDEIVVADDGSDEQTQQVVWDWEKRLPLRHVWHEKRGFGKCAVVNKAIAAAEGEYLIFSDGDCIPEPDFILSHLAAATPSRFLSGGAVRLPKEATDQLALEKIANGEIFTSRWLRRNRVHLHDRLKLVKWKLARRVLGRFSPTRPTFNGNNSSAWRSDILRVNGFDERMEYGGLDRDLGERLERAGVRGRSVRYTATLVHLDHPRGYISATGLAENRRIRSGNAATGATWTPFGISKGERGLL